MGSMNQVIGGFRSEKCRHFLSTRFLFEVSRKSSCVWKRLGGHASRTSTEPSTIVLNAVVTHTMAKQTLSNAAHVNLLTAAWQLILSLLVLLIDRDLLHWEAQDLRFLA